MNIALNLKANFWLKIIIFAFNAFHSFFFLFTRVDPFNFPESEGTKIEAKKESGSWIHSL